MKRLTARAGLVTACVVVAGCSPSSLTQADDGNGTSGAGIAGGGTGAIGSLGGTGALSGAGAGSGGTAPGGAGAFSGNGGASAGTSGIGLGGSVPSGFGGMSVAGSGGASGSAPGGSGGSGRAGQAGTAGAAPTFTELWNRTLESGCAIPYCHDGSGKGWSGFDQATAYRTLVGAGSTTCPGETRVVAGSPATSVLVAAVSHTDLGDCDVPTMPKDRAQLSQADIDRIVAWIRAGARND